MTTEYDAGSWNSEIGFRCQVSDFARVLCGKLTLHQRKTKVSSSIKLAAGASAADTSYETAF